MKLTVEIKDNMMFYSYEIGGSKHNSSKHLSADSLVRFVNLLGELSKHYEYEDKVWERESIAKAWLEKKCICGEINARHCPVHNESDEGE